MSQHRPVRIAAQAVRTALTDLAPVPATSDGEPARWYLTGVHGDNDIRSISADDLETVLNGYAS